MRYRASRVIGVFVCLAQFCHFFLPPFHAGYGYALAAEPASRHKRLIKVLSSGAGESVDRGTIKAVPASALAKGAHAEGELTLAMDVLSRRLTLDLLPSDILAPNCTVTAVSEAGEETTRPCGRFYYEGRVVGSPDSFARVTIVDGEIDALIHVDDQSLAIEPMRRYDPGASRGALIEPPRLLRRLF